MAGSNVKERIYISLSKSAIEKLERLTQNEREKTFGRFEKSNLIEKLIFEEAAKEKIQE